MRKNLPYASPESKGIPSEAITAFIDEIEQKKINMHSFMLLRNGEILAECYWPFFDAGRKQRIYSCSKSVLSVAVGMVIDEGKLSLDSKVADFFPEYITPGTHPYLLDATVRHLLMMSTPNHINSYDIHDADWIYTFFNLEGEKTPPGTRFSYDTAGTDTLCAIVEKLSGKRMLDYMRPVLDKLGISSDAWCIQSPEGRSWAGSGVMFTTLDFAKFALFCLNRGEWNGEQLVSREYMEAATSFQIDNSGRSDLEEFRFGYGYKFLMLRSGGGFACCGMGGQLALMFPEKDIAMVITSDTQMNDFSPVNGISAIVSEFFKLYEKAGSAPLPENAEAQAKLKEKISGVYTPLPDGNTATAKAAEYSGARYKLQDNQTGIKWVSVDIAPEKCVFRYGNAAGEHSIAFGMGEYMLQKSPSKYHSVRVGTADRHYDIVATGVWPDDDTFLGTMYSVDNHMGAATIKLTFSNGEVQLDMQKYTQWFFDEYRGSALGHSM